jgi:hypothetical protein
VLVLLQEQYIIKKVTNESKDIINCASVNNNLYARAECGAFVGSCNNTNDNYCSLTSCYSTSIIHKVDLSCGNDGNYSQRFGPIYGRYWKKILTTTSVWTVKDCIYYLNSWADATTISENQNTQVTTLAKTAGKPASFFDPSDPNYATTGLLGSLIQMYIVIRK